MILLPLCPFFWVVTFVLCFLFSARAGETGNEGCGVWDSAAGVLWMGAGMGAWVCRCPGARGISGLGVTAGLVRNEFRAPWGLRAKRWEGSGVPSENRGEFCGWPGRGRDAAGRRTSPRYGRGEAGRSQGAEHPQRYGGARQGGRWAQDMPTLRPGLFLVSTVCRRNGKRGRRAGF